MKRMQNGMIAMVALTLAGQQAVAEQPVWNREGIPAKCLKAYVENMFHNESVWFSSSREDYRILVARYLSLAEEIKTILAKADDASPGVVEARKLLEAAKSAAQDYQELLDLNVLSPKLGFRDQEAYKQARPVLLRGSNHEREVNNIIMQWTWDYYGMGAIFEPTPPYKD